MILINLLPEHLRPHKRSPLPHLLSFIALLVTIGVLFSMYSDLRALEREERSNIAREQKELQRLQPRVHRATDRDVHPGELDRSIDVRIENLGRDEAVVREWRHIRAVNVTVAKKISVAKSFI